MAVGFGRDVTVKDIYQNAAIFLNIERKEVEKMDFTRVANTIREFKKAGTEGRGKMYILFNGYGHYTEEIYEINEIRKFVSKLVKKYPHIYYFLNNDDPGLLGVFTGCIGDVRSFQRGPRETTEYWFPNGLPRHNVPVVALQIKISRELSHHIIDGVTQYCRKIGDNPTHVLKNIPGLQS